VYYYYERAVSRVCNAVIALRPSSCPLSANYVLLFDIRRLWRADAAGTGRRVTFGRRVQRRRKKKPNFGGGRHFGATPRKRHLMRGSRVSRVSRTSTPRAAADVRARYISTTNWRLTGPDRPVPPPPLLPTTHAYYTLLYYIIM